MKSTSPRHGNPNWRPHEVSKEWLIVELARLQELIKGKISECSQLRAENAQLTLRLGQAEAGMELADLIKRMTT